MPQRIRMRDDIQMPIATGGTVLIYGWTLESVVLFLWAAYVVVLIVTKLPEFSASIARIYDCVQGHWKRLKEWRNGR